jgi:Ser/Thr protein kinase RdoA (MazF antagonist)
MYDLITQALIPYSLGYRTLVIENELQSWSFDLHFKISLDERVFSARFVKDNRSPNNVFGEMNADILYEQTAFCRFLVNHQVPFMKLVHNAEGEPFTEIEWKNECYHFILFEWMDGQHITHFDVNISEEFGRFAREFHDISSEFNSSVFVKKSHLVGYREFIRQVRNQIKISEISAVNVKMIEDYLQSAEDYIESGRSDCMDYIIQSDLNPLNVLWNDKKQVIGIVDFESIGYGDRMEGLAWLIKWYSRTDGNSVDMSAAAARAFLKGYKAEDFLEENSLSRIASLLWLSGCMNWKFVNDTKTIIQTNNDEGLKKHIESYNLRGQRLLTMISKTYINE